MQMVSRVASVWGAVGLCVVLLVGSGCQKRQTMRQVTKVTLRLREALNRPRPSRKAVADAVRLLGSDSSLMSTNAAALLSDIAGRCPSDEIGLVVRGLARLLGSSDPMRRLAGGVALMRFGKACRIVQRRLRRAALSRHMRSSWYAIITLGKLGRFADAKSVDALIKVIRCERNDASQKLPDAALYAAKALGRIGHGSAGQVRAVGELMARRRGALKMRLAYAVAVMGDGDAAAMKVLKRGIASGDKHVRAIAKKAVARLNHGDRGGKRAQVSQTGGD